MSIAAGSLIARLALRFIVSAPAVLAQFATAVQNYKRLAPTDAEIQALPDDRSAIEAFARQVDEAQRENADITSRLRARAEAEDGGS